MLLPAPPTGTAFSPFERPRRSWALALLSFLRARQLWPQRRLVLYAFSNGGAFVVEQLMLLAEQDRRWVGTQGRCQRGRLHRANHQLCLLSLFGPLALSVADIICGHRSD